MAAMVVLFAASLYALYGEASVFVGGNSTPASRFEAKARGGFSSGLSFFSQEIALRDCDDSLKSEYSRSQDLEERSSAMRNCRDFALDIARNSPANGLAWFIAAQSSAWLGDYDEMNRYLAMSQATTAHNAVLAAGRAFLMVSVETFLSEQSRETLRADLETLSSSRYGLEKLVQLYVSQPGTRDLLTSFMETFPPETQRRFLSALRKQVS